MNPEPDFDFEERAAIMEYDGKLTRQQAERKARLVVDYFRKKQAANAASEARRGDDHGQ